MGSLININDIIQSEIILQYGSAIYFQQIVSTGTSKFMIFILNEGGAGVNGFVIIKYQQPKQQSPKRNETQYTI